jgi:hypothetical protein
MTTPISVPITPIVVIGRNKKRNTVRFQNIGTFPLYFVRQIGETTNVPSITNYEFVIQPSTVTDPNDSFVSTNSTAQFNAVAIGGVGGLAIFETYIV